MSRLLDPGKGPEWPSSCYVSPAEHQHVPMRARVLRTWEVEMHNMALAFATLRPALAGPLACASARSGGWGGGGGAFFLTVPSIRSPFPYPNLPAPSSLINRYRGHGSELCEGPGSWWAPETHTTC